MSKIGKITFGKYKGTPFNKIPIDYLEWLRKNIDVFGELKQYLYDMESEKHLNNPKKIKKPENNWRKRKLIKSIKKEINVSGIKLFFDGSYSPTRTAWGFVVYKGNKIIHEECSEHKFNDDEESSVNVSEYLGLIHGLDYLVKNGHESANVFGDSTLVINQMNGDWQVKEGIYTEYALEALEIKECFLDIKFKWIPRELNTYADDLSKKHEK